MESLILIAVAFVGFKIGQAVIRAGRAMNITGFASSEGKFLFSVNK